MIGLKDAKIMAKGQNTAVRLINSSDPQTLATIISKSGGHNSRQAKALQAGVIQKLLDSSTVVERGRNIIDVRKFTNALATLKKRGILDVVLTKEQLTILRDRDLMVSFFRQAADAGSSIQAATIGADIAAGLTIPIQPRKGTLALIRGITAAARNALIGRLFTTSAGRMFFTGVGRLAAGRIQPDFTTLRFLAVAATQSITRMNAQASLEGFNPGDDK